MADLHCPSGELRRDGMETILLNSYPIPSDEGNSGTMASHYQKTIITVQLFMALHLAVPAFITLRIPLYTPLMYVPVLIHMANMGKVAVNQLGNIKGTKAVEYSLTG